MRISESHLLIVRLVKKTEMVWGQGEMGQLESCLRHSLGLCPDHNMDRGGGGVGGVLTTPRTGVGVGVGFCVLTTPRRGVGVGVSVS